MRCCKCDCGNKPRGKHVQNSSLQTPDLQNLDPKPRSSSLCAPDSVPSKHDTPRMQTLNPTPQTPQSTSLPSAACSTMPSPLVGMRLERGLTGRWDALPSGPRFGGGGFGWGVNRGLIHRKDFFLGGLLAVLYTEKIGHSLVCVVKCVDRLFPDMPPPEPSANNLLSPRHQAVKPLWPPSSTRRPTSWQAGTA